MGKKTSFSDPSCSNKIKTIMTAFMEGNTHFAEVTESNTNCSV